MDGQWEQTQPLEGFSKFGFERGRFVAASKWDGIYHEWHVFRRLDDGSLEKLDGVWVQLGDPPNLSIALSWADDQISKAE